MYIVFKDNDGDLKWEDKFEVTSLESFVEEHNGQAVKLGSKRPVMWLDSPHKATETFWDGKIKGTYHPCKKEIHQLL